MSVYLGVTAVKKVGKPVVRAGNSQPYVPFGYRLVAILNNGLWQIAPDVTSRDEYAAHYKSYYSGQWLDMDLFLITQAQVAECPDEGRVSVGSL